MNPVVEMLNGARPAGTHWDDCPKYHYVCAAIKEIERLEAEAEWHRIENRCPSCGHQSLFVGKGGWLTCSVIGCKDPCAATSILKAALEAELRRRSFAFGNANLDNPNVTQQMVDDAADEME